MKAVNDSAIMKRFKLRLRHNPAYKPSIEEQIASHCVTVYYFMECGRASGFTFQVDGILRAITGQKVV